MTGWKIALIVAMICATTAKGANAGTEATVKISVVYDNNALEGYGSAWGFGCVIDTGGKRILFDTGGRWKLLKSNMERLGIDPGSIETVFISHLHGDHTGGLTGICEAGKNLTVYLPHSGSESLAGRLEAMGHSAVRVRESLAIAPGVLSTGEMSGPPPEQGLIIPCAQGFILIAGCAHPKIDRMTEQAKEIAGAKPVFVMGGFHLVTTTARTVEQIARRMKVLGVERIAPCHCTGNRAVKVFERIFGDDCLSCAAGRVFEFR